MSSHDENARLRSELRAVYESMSERGGDEYAYEWLYEVWGRVVSLETRKAIGDTVTVEEES